MGSRPSRGPGAAPIAVVGVGCRFPGGARDLASFGVTLSAGADVLRAVPADRWRGDLLPRSGGIANQVGGFLDDIDRFDAAYFGIPPREAGLIDPQHRVLMETAWEAMANSGRPRDAWRGSRTAVFVGMLANDYQLLHARTLGIGGAGPHYASGLEFSFAAGRLAYTFDLHGPVMAINSACSSSLLAVHQACQSLRAGECDTAIAGGVSLLISPELSIFLSSVGAMSPTGRCRPFDAAADGLVRGEGCAVVVLKHLDAALRDGDAIHAVLRGSAVTHDGVSLGLTAPNAEAQAAMLRGALESCGLGPDGVDYVEAHGTGTQLGDQIELGTLAEVYGAARPAGSPLLVGSLKAIFGHMDAAAGVAGLLKALWVASTARVPAQPGFETPNPAVDWANGGIAVPVAALDLNPPDRPARAGVSSFGLSGTNVHMIVEAPPDGVPLASRPGPHLLLVSSARRGQLTEQVARLRSRVEVAGDLLADIVASAATRSTHEAHRYAAVGATAEELPDALGDPDDLPDGAYAGTVSDPDHARAPVFVYAGQGGQWAGMAVDLYRCDRVVRDTLDECQALVQAEASWSLLDELRRDRDDGWHRTDVAQPAIFAIQVAVTRWLTEHGVRPAAVVGHSMGEVAAAHAAGCLSLPDAVRVIVNRARLLHETAGTGCMYAVQGEPATVTAILKEHTPQVVVAAVNGPATVIIAGAAAAVEEAAEALARSGLRCRRLSVDAASHSPLVAHCGPLLAQALTAISPRPAAVRLLSCVEPDETDSGLVRVDAAYWARNLTQPVRFWPVVAGLLDEDDQIFVEIGPHPVLAGPLSEAVRHRGRAGAVIGTLYRESAGAPAMYRALAQLFVAGARVDWERVTGHPRRHQPLPPPMWGGERYWLPGVARGMHTSPSAPAQVNTARTTGHSGATWPTIRPPSAAAPAPVAPAPPTPAPGSLHRAGVAERIEAVVRGVLALPDGTPLIRRRGLFEQGMDSLTAAEAYRRLEEEFGVTLPSTVVFEHPTVTALADFLTAMGMSAGPEPIAADGPNTPPPPGSGPDSDGIAVIGMACRLPGAESPDELWALLRDGRDTVREPPAGRRDDPIWTEGGVDIPTRSCYLDDVSGFDASFFRISPREARSVDPQQRLFLEVAWEALEDAGCPPLKLADQPVGVYVGLEAADYQQLLTRDMKNVDLYYGTGASFAAVAGRLSYFLGLRGPSLVVDTACSASLTAVHLACQALRAGDCAMAVVGGAHVMVAPTLLVAMTESEALAPDGRCKTFDDAADGYGCGEGAAALVLKPLAAARRDGDRVYAVIRGSAVNQDGASGGFTIPNAAAQTAVVRQALARAGWQPEDVDYVEAHGTGTPLGDPIEVNALAAAYGPGRDTNRPLLVGSIKPNIGHLAAAAGVVGLLKVVLSLYRGEIARHLLDRPSSRIDWAQIPVRVVTEHRRWPAGNRPARAGVSSFGLTGTNVHVLAEAVPRVAPPAAPTGRPVVLPVTAADPAALRAAVTRMAAWLRSAHDEIGDIVDTATHGRSHLEHRVAVVGRDRSDLAEALEQLAASLSDVPPTARVGRAAHDTVREVTFRYGPELPAAGVRDALLAVPGYERAFHDCLAGLTGSGCAPRDTPPAELHAAYLFCHHVAATRLWAEFGVRPAHAIGEGTGRVTAAWARGDLSVDDALRILVSQEEPALPGAPPDPAAEVVAVLPELAADPVTSIALTVADLFVTGYQPVGLGPARRRISLPGYPWQRRTYWYRTLQPSEADVLPFALSAATSEGLRADAARLTDFVRERREQPAAVAAGLAGRAQLPFRAVVIGGDHGGVAAALEALAAGRDHPAVVTGPAGGAGGAGAPVMVFPGAGTQWAGMAAGLLRDSPVFAAGLADCDQALRPHTGWSVLEVLAGGAAAPAADRVDVAQPVLFAVMVALARVWLAHGVRPAAVIGHSQGEIAAAHVAGALSLADAARVVAVRGQALVALSGHGAMASVNADCDAVCRYLDEHPGLSLAGVNSPANTLVAGAPGAIDAYLDYCREHGIRARRIPVDYASHSPQVEAVRDRIVTALAGVVPRAGAVPVYSTVTGQVVDPGELTAGYWYRNLRQPVQLHRAVQALLGHGHTVFLEVSPHPVLTPAIDDTAQHAGAAVTVLETLRRDQDSRRFFIRSLADAYVQGLGVRWEGLLPEGTTAARLPIATGETTVSGNGLGDGEARFWQALDAGDTGSLMALIGLGPEADATALTAAVPLLKSWRDRQRQTASLDSCRYGVEWRPVPDRGIPHAVGSWLVVLPSGDVAASPWLAGCGQALREHGAQVHEVVVDAGDASPAGLAQRLRAALPDGPPLAGVASLLAFDEAPHSGNAAVPRGLAATVALLQALDAVGIDARCWFLSCGATSADATDDVPHPAHAQAQGLARVSGLDDPRRWGGQVDLPAEPDTLARRRLCTALTGIGDEDQLAVRNAGILARRLVRRPRTGSSPAPWRPRGTVLVTGGTGALGAHIARWLAREGARHLILLSRGGVAAPGAPALRQELEEMGAAVTVVACDVADRAALERVLSAIPPQEPLRAVFHLAGVVGARKPVGEVTQSDLVAVLGPKAAGARHLDDLLDRTPLDAFVLFSSGAGVWGSGLQGPYAAANAFLDALAQGRRAAGRPATSVAWGAWAGEGGSADEESARFLARRGVRPMPVDLALAALHDALSHDETFVAVADVDWSLFATGFAAARRRPLLDELMPAPAPDAVAVPSRSDMGKAGLTARLDSLPPPARERLLLKLVIEEVAGVLRYDDGQPVEEDRPFKDLGFDSLTGMQLRDRLIRRTGLRLPSTLVFDQPTPLALASHLLAELTPPEPARDSHPQPVRPAAIDAMAVSELVQLAHGKDAS